MNVRPGSGGIGSEAGTGLVSGRIVVEVVASGTFKCGTSMIEASPCFSGKDLSKISR